jgi:hypothetical protein
MQKTISYMAEDPLSPYAGELSFCHILAGPN